MIQVLVRSFSSRSHVIKLTFQIIYNPGNRYRSLLMPSGILLTSLAAIVLLSFYSRYIADQHIFPIRISEESLQKFNFSPKRNTNYEFSITFEKSNNINIACRLGIIFSNILYKNNDNLCGNTKSNLDLKIYVTDKFGRKISLDIPYNNGFASDRLGVTIGVARLNCCSEYHVSFESNDGNIDLNTLNPQLEIGTSIVENYQVNVFTITVARLCAILAIVATTMLGFRIYKIMSSRTLTDTASSPTLTPSE